MKSLARQLLFQALVSAIVAGAVLGIHERRRDRTRPTIGTVDLNSVYRQKEAEFVRRIGEAQTEEERMRVMSDARQFARRLPSALEALPQECRCTVLLRTAIAAPTPEMLDLTPKLQRSLHEEPTR